MGSGVRYTYKGYLPDKFKNTLFAEKEQLETINEMLWQEILVYMAQTPPIEVPDIEGNPMPYAEALTVQFRQIKSSIEENLREIHQIEDCIEAMEQDSESVVDA